MNDTAPKLDGGLVCCHLRYLPLAGELGKRLGGDLRPYPTTAERWSNIEFCNGMSVRFNKCVGIDEYEPGDFMADQNEVRRPLGVGEVMR